MDADDRRMCEWAVSCFGEGCLLGDIAKEALDAGKLTGEEHGLLAAALEGFLAAGGTYR